MFSKCSSERKSHMSFVLNQKLETIKLSEEGMSKFLKPKSNPEQGPNSLLFHEG